MAVTNMPKTTLEVIAEHIRQRLPELTVHPGNALCWSPKSNTITYRAGDSSDENIWGLLHEAGHATLRHSTYNSDVELLLLEVSAWQTATVIAADCSVAIDSDHIEDCLDTYRDWLHQRSTCPRCGIVTFQVNSRTYRCFNCQNTWTVSSSRLCRPYRLSSDHTKNRLEPEHQAVFQSKAT